MQAECALGAEVKACDPCSRVTAGQKCAVVSRFEGRGRISRMRCALVTRYQNKGRWGRSGDGCLSLGRVGGSIRVDDSAEGPCQAMCGCSGVDGAGGAEVELGCVSLTEEAGEVGLAGWALGIGKGSKGLADKHAKHRQPRCK